MTELKQDVAIHFTNLDNAKNRIWLSSGIKKYSSLVNNDKVSYEPDSFLPNPPWEKPSELAISSLINKNHPWKSEKSIGVFSIPDEILKALQEISKFIEIQPLSHLAESIQVDYKITTDKLLNYLINHKFTDINIEERGIYMRRNNLITTSRSYSNCKLRGQYVGLHIDTCDNLDLKNRYKSRNRMCINIGFEERFFVFVNLTLTSMVESLKTSNQFSIYNYHPNDIIKIFMNTYPNYPVTKLLLKPGEAYIAPTQNIIHDATTINKKMNDITFTYLGNFNLNI